VSTRGGCKSEQKDDDASDAGSCGHCTRVARYSCSPNNSPSHARHTPPLKQVSKRDSLVAGWPHFAPSSPTQAPDPHAQDSNGTSNPHASSSNCFPAAGNKARQKRCGSTNISPLSAIEKLGREGEEPNTVQSEEPRRDNYQLNYGHTTSQPPLTEWDRGAFTPH